MQGVVSWFSSAVVISVCFHNYNLLVLVSLSLSRSLSVFFFFYSQLTKAPCAVQEGPLPDRKTLLHLFNTIALQLPSSINY